MVDVAPLSFLLNYCILSLAGVTGSYVLMRAAYAPRCSPVLWYSYFGFKTLVDALLWYAINTGAGDGWVGGFQTVWLFVMGIISMFVVYRAFDGDLFLVVLCAVICDLISAICMSFGTVAANIACGLPVYSGYFMPFGLHTLLTAAIIVALVLLLCVPVGWMLRWICRLVLRNRVAWGLAAAAVALFFVATTQRLSSYLSVSTCWPFVWSLVAGVMAAFALTLLFRARDIRKREEMLRTCLGLTKSYDQAIKDQLDDLEAALSALEGHELALGALGERDGEKAGHVRELQDAYRRLSTGVYCERPSLDAVLSTCARRLNGLGVRTVFTVAAVPAGTVIPATVTLALLNLACEAAERTGDACEGTVNLRVRGVGEQVLLRLSVPERWGALWAKRCLSAFDVHGTTMIRERREGLQRVVLVVVDPVSVMDA